MIQFGINNSCKFITLIFLMVALFGVHKASAQETMVMGQVLTATDRTPIESVNIAFKNSTNAVQTNNEGYFLLKKKGLSLIVVFSAVGYKTKELRVKPGKSNGVEVLLEKEEVMLQEVFVKQNSGLALAWIKKIKDKKAENDLWAHPNFVMNGKDELLVELNQIPEIYKQDPFEISKNPKSKLADSSSMIPLFVGEYKFQQRGREKTIVEEKIFNSPKAFEKLLSTMLLGVKNNFNFYDNTVQIFGKGIVSPLAQGGTIFYNYYLTDSFSTHLGKQYEINFRTKNPKNLAFIGKLRFDSTTMAITQIEANLPSSSNINYINKLQIIQHFKRLPSNKWSCNSEVFKVNMDYSMVRDSNIRTPEMRILRATHYQLADSVLVQPRAFAQSNYTLKRLEERLEELNTTSEFKTAKWITSAVMTGYIPVGMVDIGKIQSLVRVNNLEGVRVTLPLQTNEQLMKNMSVGGFVGYGFGNGQIRYSAMGNIKFPSIKKRILGLQYTNDYRRIDYNYNNFVLRESPFLSGDEDVVSSIFGANAADKLSLRKEFTLTLSNDWNNDVESHLLFRSNTLYSNHNLPMFNGAEQFTHIAQQSITAYTRISFSETSYEDHLRRIYAGNNKPDIYLTGELGQFSMANNYGAYGKFVASIKHKQRFIFGKINYLAEAGTLLGTVPYPLLLHPSAKNFGYSFYSFNRMNYLEYASDKYISMHSELILDGLIFNQIPIVKQLNFREMFTCKMIYGSLNNDHKTLMDFPVNLKPLHEPYTEIGVGVTNVLRLFCIQYIWQFGNNTNINPNAGVLRATVSVAF